MAVRLYIGGLSTDTNVQDLQVLLNKVCPIHYIYFPEPAVTYLPRGFAIAILQQTDDVKEKALKCVKLYNNCHWKGCKMRVELAKEYYVDRIKRELSSRVDDDLLAMKKKSRNEYEMVKPFIGNVICIKKTRYQVPVYASTVPHDAIASTEDNSNIIYAKKTLFKYDDNGNLLDDIIEHKHDEKQKVTQEISTSSTKQKTVNPAVVPVVDTSIAKEKGGGMRKGFGTLAASSKDNANDCCVENVKQLHTFDNYEIDEAPCLQPEDVDDSALESERLRQLQFISQLLGTTEGTNDAIATSSTTTSSLGITDMTTDPVAAGKSFTNTKVMKEIFHKEGGVWWGDDGTMKEAVEKGEVDPLFLEAEKYGIDIRSSNENNDQNIMKFSFFDDEPINHEPVIANNDNNKHELTTTVNSYHADPVDAAVTEEVVDVQPMSITDIINNARLFVRDDSVDNIISNWKNVRLKLAVDYKRKCRDARKKMGTKKAAAQVTALVPPTHKEINKDWKQKKRGGVKHRKKA